MFKLIKDHERFWFVLDTNLDGSFTISDVPELLKQIYFLPGDLAYYIIFFQIPQYAPKIIEFYIPILKFLEIKSMDQLYGNFLSGIFSFFIWLIIFLILYSIKISFENNN